MIEYPPLFADFLAFERQVFGDPRPIALYDPYLIRYGEYRFILGSLPLEAGVDVVDLGCETNLLMLFLAIRRANVIGLDLDPALAQTVEERKELVHKVTGVEPSLQFVVGDATNHNLRPSSADVVVATSSIEHMFSDLGHGDQLAVDGIRRVLRPGGIAAITVPMSNGAPFHESPTGDERFAGPYRLYTPAVLAKRLLSNPELRTAQHKYLAHATPDPTSEDGRFHQFWLELTPEERLKWSWANPILSAVFNPIVGAEEEPGREAALNTALLLLQKKG